MMMSRNTLLAFCIILNFGAFVTSSSSKVTNYWAPKELGTFYLKDVGFIDVYETHPEAENYSERFTAYFTTFNPLALLIHDPVYRIQSPGKILDSVNTWNEKLEKLGGRNSAYWPNYSVKLPKEISGFEGIIQTSGFLVPGKGSGQLEVYNEETLEGPWNIASQDSKTWSYHWNIWYDVDADGLKDVMAARFHVDLFGNTESEFVWMKNPGNLDASGGGWSDWEQHLLIKNGPDVYIKMQTLMMGDTEYSVILAGELWTQRVMLYYVENVAGAWSYPENIGSVEIASNLGLIFQADFIDVNADGRLEAISSSTDEEKNEGSLNVWLMPDNWMEDPWTRVPLATGFVPRTGFLSSNLMTPGKMLLFYPSNDYAAQKNEDGTSVKPWISLSGDDNGRHYILYPSSEDKNDWTYNQELIIDSEAQTVGTQAIVDLDGDGYMELIAAGYSADTVYVHTFKTE